MIETITALVAFMTSVQAFHVNPDIAAMQGRSWAYSVQTNITDAQLNAAKAPCCSYIKAGDGKILRVGKYTVFLVKD